MDRFERGLPDPQEAEVIDYRPCGGEIYEGQQAVMVGHVLHCNYRCVAEAFGAVTITAGEEDK